MNIFRALFGLALISTLASASLWAQVPDQHFVIVGVDGFGSAGMKSSSTPRLIALEKAGAWTLHARAVIPTVSSPNWASIIMGAGPAQHGITSNEWERNRFDISPTCTVSDQIFPTIFGLLKTQQPSSHSAVFHHWSGFGRLVEHGVPDEVVHRETAPETMAAAIAYWNQHKPNLLFVHLDLVDDAGHEHGWDSPEYKAAASVADKLIGNLKDAVDQSGVATKTYFLVTADHGGVGKKHGGLSMAELEIPWILVGPNVKRGYELKSLINTYDTAATVAYTFQLTTPECWIAKPVREAIEKK
jgi:predicted AlkP superfamily pyrophosphatase or phosphodiesterase